MITNERVRALIACDREALITLMAAARSRGLYDVWKDLDIRALFDAVDAELAAPLRAGASLDRWNDEMRALATEAAP